jgi:hypothetical protein
MSIARQFGVPDHIVCPTPTSASSLLELFLAFGGDFTEIFNGCVGNTPISRAKFNRNGLKDVFEVDDYIRKRLRGDDSVRVRFSRVIVLLDSLCG